MIPVSDSYNPFPQVRRVGFLATFKLVDLHANDNSTMSTSSASPVSRLDQVLDDIQVPSGRFASLEPNLWLLDGSMRCVDTDRTGEQVGWWSAWLSQQDRTFYAAAVPFVQFTFSAPVSSFGFTLNFDGESGEPPAEVVTRTYSGETLLETKTDTCSGSTIIIEMPTESYDKVVFNFTKSSFPKRRVRLTECVFGIVKTYDSTNLSKASLSYEANPTAESLPSRQLNLTIDNSKREYNMRNPDSIYAYLQDGQEIRVRCSIGGELIDMGKFHFTSASAKDGGVTAALQANDRIYSLDDAAYSPGEHHGKTISLSVAVAEVLAGRGINCQYAPNLADRLVRLSPPKDSSIRDVIRLLAQAARCTAWIDRADNLRFEDLSVSAIAVQSYGFDDMYDADSISIRDKVGKVTINATRVDTDSEGVYYTYGDGEEGKTISNPCVEPGSGSAVAEWIFGHCQKRVKYKFRNRCDPAVEIGDTVSVADTFGDPGLALITGIDLAYNGGLSAVNEGVGS